MRVGARIALRAAFCGWDCPGEWSSDQKPLYGLLKRFGDVGECVVASRVAPIKLGGGF